MSFWKSLFGGGKTSTEATAGPGGEVISLNRTVDLSAERAFDLFVDRIGEWWPRDYSWAKDSLETIVIEPRYGGRVFERSRDGAIAVFGKVLSFERPSHLVFTWQIRPDRTPETEEGLASRVDVRFLPTTPERTEVILVHRDFFRHGDGWQDYAKQMAAKSGWPRILDLYSAAAKAGS